MICAPSGHILTCLCSCPIEQKPAIKLQTQRLIKFNSDTNTISVNNTSRMTEKPSLHVNVGLSPVQLSQLTSEYQSRVSNCPHLSFSKHPPTRPPTPTASPAHPNVSWRVTDSVLGGERRATPQQIWEDVFIIVSLIHLAGSGLITFLQNAFSESSQASRLLAAFLWWV